MDRQYFFGQTNNAGQQCAPAAGDNGNIWHIMDGLPGGLNSQHYTYDPLNRLQTWSGSNASGTIRKQGLWYDSFGNISQSNGYPPPAGSPDPLTFAGSYDSSNRLLPSSFGCAPLAGGTPGQTSGYDLAGNVLCQGTQNVDAKAFVWDAENRIGQTWAVQNNAGYWQQASYLYDADGNRVRADQYVPQSNPLATKSWREYAYFNGQMLAEKDQTGAWTDYIYAGGKRIAQINPTFAQLHVHGQHTASGCATDIRQAGLGGYQYVIQPGDRLIFDQQVSNATGGLILIPFSAPTTTDQIADAGGFPMNGLPDTHGGWQHRTLDLSSIASQQINGFWPVTTTSGSGAYDELFANASIVSTSGTVTPIFSGQPVHNATGVDDSCGQLDSTLAVETAPEASASAGNSGTVQVTVGFTNDACVCTGDASAGDRNLYVAGIFAGNTAADLASAIYSPCLFGDNKGSNLNGNGALVCNGTVTVTLPAGQPVSVAAYGSQADSINPHMQVLVNGYTLYQVDVPPQQQSYAVLASAPGLGITFYTADQVGTTQMEISATGTPLWKGEFAPFGQELDYQTTQNRYKFTGKERDTESGLDYFGARYYASNMGRWMSPDWAAKADPVPYAKLDNPQSLNLYGYVLNNPLSQKDDDGHEIIYADGLKNGQLVRDSVTAILANPNTSSYLSGYVGPNAPNLIIQSGDLGPPTVTTLPNGQTLTTTVQGNTGPDIQTTQMNNDPPQTTLTGATITIDNNTSKGDTPGVMIHESVHAGEAQKNPAQFNKDAKAERGQPHDSRPQEQRANGVRAANEKQIKQQIKQIEKDRKKDQQ